MKSIEIDLVSDVVCPWCAVGYYRLKRAADKLGIELLIHWHPFELNPNMPAEGEDLYDHFMNKYRMSAEQTNGLGATLKRYGAPLGFEFNYPQGNRMRNTFKVHQLLAWAKPQKAETRLYEALFTAYFTHQQDIASTEVLRDIIESVDLNRDEAQSILSQNLFAESVREKERKWMDKGIDAVPTMIFPGPQRVGGAQPLEHYEQLLLAASK